jgi:hypothetical protein
MNASLRVEILWVLLATAATAASVAAMEAVGLFLTAAEQRLFSLKVIHVFVSSFRVTITHRKRERKSQSGEDRPESSCCAGYINQFASQFRVNLQRVRSTMAVVEFGFNRGYSRRGP